MSFQVRRALRRCDEAVEVGDRGDDTTRHSAAVGRLSLRERQVLAGIMAGRKSKQIAEDLAISARTVEFHRANLMRKMNAQSAAHLVMLAMSAP